MKLNAVENTYEKQTQRFIKYILNATILFLFISTVGFKFLNMNLLTNFPIINDMYGINFILGLISIPSCWLYYKMYKNNEFFLLTLSYISIWIEFIAINNTFINLKIEHLILFPFLFRVAILTLAIFNNSNLSQWILKKKRLSIFLAIMINVVGTFLEANYNLNINFGNNIGIFIDLLIICYYYYLLALLAKRGIAKKELIYTVIISSISIFTIRRIFYFSFFNKSLNEIITYTRILSLIGFMILLIGLYLEIIRKIEEGDQLNTYVEKTEEKYSNIKEIEKIRTQFFANISHEIRTPINIIYSCVQLLEVKKQVGEKELTEAYNKYDNTIKQNCYRMLRLVNNLVDITKIESGFMNMHFVNYEIVSLVEDITISIVPYVETKQINVIFDTYIEELEIKCDPESIERVILNLLSNSVKFTNLGGNIFVTMDYNEEWVTISIKDDGIGIPYELKDIIFERFIQADKSLNRMKEGSGIGLALVKSLIELHNGKVFINKDLEQGSEFIIKLPNVRLYGTPNVNQEIEDKNKSIIDKIHIEFSDIYELY